METERASEGEMRSHCEPTVNPVGYLSHISVMDLLPALATTVLASMASRLMDSAAVQNINRRINKR